MSNIWKAYESDKHEFDFSGDALSQSWDRLHAGNLEPFPDDPRLQQAWRCYHQGDFRRAVEKGYQLGAEGGVVTAFSTVIYAQYIEDDGDEKIKLFQEAIALCEELLRVSPDNANLHYMHAVAMGRYSQFISMVEALQQGVGKKIRDALDRCLELSPTHAEALVTLGGWNAEIVDKAGVMLGKMMYGATKENSVANYHKALELAPDSPIPCIEYAYGLQLMYGEMKLSDTVSYLEKAIALDPADAMQALDQQIAEIKLKHFRE